MKTIKQVFTVLTVTLFLLFSNNINAQKTKLTKEEIRLGLSEGMVSFVGGINEIILTKPELFFDENCKSCKPSHISFNNLLKGLGVKTEKLTKDGNDLLHTAFLFIQNNTTEDDILDNYDGVEVLNALKYIHKNESKSNKSNIESELFGLNSDSDIGDFSKRRCCWICIQCHVDSVVTSVLLALGIIR